MICSLHQHWNLKKQHWGGPIRELPTDLIDKWRPLALLCCWCWFDASSSVSFVHLGRRPSKPDTKGCSQVWEHNRHQPIHTKRPSQKLCLLSVRACQHDWGPPVCDWWPGFCVFLKLTRAGSVGWELSLFCLVYIILIISLTNPAVEYMYVRMCAHVRS